MIQILCTDGDLVPNLSAGSNNNIGTRNKVGKYWNKTQSYF